LWPRTLLRVGSRHERRPPCIRGLPDVGCRRAWPRCDMKLLPTWLLRSGRTPPNSAGWPKALPVVADVGENHGGAAEGHRFHGGWVTPHRPRSAAAKLMLMLCRVEAAPDIGSILHLAPPLLVVPSMVPRKDIAYQWQGGRSSAPLACRASATYNCGYHTERGQNRDQRAAAGSGVLSAGSNGNRSMLWILDPGLAPKVGAKSPSHVFSRPGRRWGSVPPGPGDYGVRRARVGTVSSVSTVVAFSLDWLLARPRRRTTATAT
jgi:hypothetical protein